ncbi:MAG: hypothetical protein H0T42_05620 [Deltaproteobacteria bacterium]|nr:hypothetical protein [Deltaproteobacteria bacterium]
MLLHRSTALIALLSLALAPLAAAQPTQIAVAKPDRSYEKMVAKVANMIDDERAYTLAAAQKLQLLNVLWEDTGRWEGSSVGPNISDVTIEVEGVRNGKKHRTYLMPVMRHDNFTDKTADVKMDKILIPIGNQREQGQLELVTLTDLLDNIEQYLSVQDKGKIKGSSLLAKKRDSHVLVSAQHAFLPVPKEGKATFWPVIFNYQSTKKNPAVLTILVTRQGTSITIIDNARDTVSGGDSWGQRLYFNSGGKKAPLIAERLTDVKNAGVTANGESAASLGADSNVLMLIQVPLKYREPPRRAMQPMNALANDGPGGAPAKAAQAPAAESAGQGQGRSRDRSDVDVAVLGHGKTEGPFTELDGLTIQRDARFPVRVTLQFYQATSNGVISRDNVREMAAQIKKVYGKGDFVGSLVVPTELDRQRPTAWTGASNSVFAAWRDFPGLVERFAASLMLRPRLGVI